MWERSVSGEEGLVSVSGEEGLVSVGEECELGGGIGECGRGV